MAVYSPHPHGPFYVHTPLENLRRTLDAEANATLNQLIHVLRPPIGEVGIWRVLTAAEVSIECYGKSLVQPTETFFELKGRVNHLRIQAEVVRHEWDVVVDLEEPLKRRLLTVPAWALMYYLGKCPEKAVEQRAAGVELAYSLAVGKPFMKGYANALRRALKAERYLGDAEPSNPTYWKPHFNQVLREAAALFEGGPGPEPGSDDREPFEKKAVSELRNRSLYATAKRRQAMLDRGNQSPLQFHASASHLRERAEGGDHTAMLIMLSALTGLTMETCMRIPLAGRSVDEWVMVLDFDEGTIKTNLEAVFKNPAKSEKSSIHRAAARVSVKPVPQFLQDIGRRQVDHEPLARTLGDLIPTAMPSGSELTNTNTEAGISPSAKRFQQTVAAYAIHLGIDRLRAGLLCNDFSVFPSSKLYYCMVPREEMWDAAERFFQVIGWGKPAQLVAGLPFGSRVVPERTALIHWYQWMVSQLRELAPGRRYTLKSLLEHHNAFSRFCASLAVLLLGAREVKELRLTAAGLCHEGSYTCLGDKWVGVFPAPLPVPISRLLAKQVKYYLAHCLALDRRLQELGVPTASPLRNQLAAIGRGAAVPLFFHVEQNLKVKPLGSADLTKWWPESHRFEPDFGRHFWQVEHRDGGLLSSQIDAFVRHNTRGVEFPSSTSSVIWGRLAKAITDVQDDLFSRMGIEPFPGLSRI